MTSDKIQIIYVCSSCGAQFSKWNGRCLECGGWGTLQKQAVDQSSITGGGAKASPAEIIDLAGAGISGLSRIKTNISEVDRVLGGGIMPGSLILLSGEPGIGKSTIVAQVAEAVAGGDPVIYISGEESAGQIKGRFDRLHIDYKKIKFVSEINIERILASVELIKPIWIFL